MRSLIFNFIKRSILIPVVVTALAIAMLMYTFGGMVKESQNKLEPAVITELDLSGYNSSSYSEFSGLESGEFVGTIACEEAGLDEKPVCYDVGDNTEISLYADSTEPWNDGALLITGMDTAPQLKEMHGVSIGNELVFSAAGKASYRYEVNAIAVGVNEEDLEAYLKPGTLAVAVPYKNLSSSAASNLFIVYSAKQIQEG